MLVFCQSPLDIGAPRLAAFDAFDALGAFGALGAFAFSRVQNVCVLLVPEGAKYLDVATFFNEQFFLVLHVIFQRCLLTLLAFFSWTWMRSIGFSDKNDVHFPSLSQSTETIHSVPFFVNLNGVASVLLDVPVDVRSH